MSDIQPDIPPPKSTLSEMTEMVEQPKDHLGKGTIATTREKDKALFPGQVDYLQTFTGPPSSKKELFRELRAGAPAMQKPQSEATTEAAIKEFEGNPWLVVNMMVAVHVNLMTLMDMMKDSRITELKLRLDSMDAVMDLANNQAANTLKAAEIEAKMYETRAAAAAVQMAFGIAAAGAGFALAGGSLGRGRTKVDKFGNVKSSGMGKSGAASSALLQAGVVSSVNQVGRSGSEMIMNLMLAQQTREKAQYDARKEVLKGFQEIAQMMLQSAREADQQLMELITKTLELLRQIDSAHKQAAGFKLQG